MAPRNSAPLGSTAVALTASVCQHPIPLPAGARAAGGREAPVYSSTSAAGDDVLTRSLQHRNISVVHIGMVIMYSDMKTSLPLTIRPPGTIFALAWCVPHNNSGT